MPGLPESMMDGEGRATNRYIAPFVERAIDEFQRARFTYQQGMDGVHAELTVECEGHVFPIYFRLAVGRTKAADLPLSIFRKLGGDAILIIVFHFPMGGQRDSFIWLAGDAVLAMLNENEANRADITLSREEYEELSARGWSALVGYLKGRLENTDSD